MNALLPEQPEEDSPSRSSKTAQEKDVPSIFQRQVCWAALSGIAIAVIVSLVVGLVIGLGYLFVALEAVLLPVIIAGILAYLLFPLVIMVQKKVKNRLYSVLIVLFSTLILVGSLLATIIPPLVQQTGELIDNRQEIYKSAIATGQNLLTKPYVQSSVDLLFQNALKEKKEKGDAESVAELKAITEDDYQAKVLAILNHNGNFVVTKAWDYLTAGTRALTGVLSFIIGFVLVPVLLFYFLLESERISKNWHSILPLRRSYFRHELVETIQQINGYVIAFIRGQMLVSVIDGAMLGIALLILGLPYAITIGVAAALIGIIPYIGMILTSVPALLIAWFTWGDPTYVVAVGVIFIAVSQFDGWVIQPRILGNQVGMHDLTIMFSVIFWGMVFGGIIGALIAVPLTASIKVIFTRYVWASFVKNKPAVDKETPEEIA